MYTWPHHNFRMAIFKVTGGARSWFSATIPLAVCFTPAVFGQALDSTASHSVDTSEIQRLNETITSQAGQIAAQQARIEALEAGLAEQKDLLNKLLKSGSEVLASLSMPPGSLPSTALAPVSV
jgi:hypothetical protein